jgi:2-oxoglutarate ferredoxin oxidoreductase subunit beta
MAETKYTATDYKSDQYVRLCPGCGDHGALMSLHRALAEVGVAPENVALISGIGCSSRIPYYTKTYGFHTIHGRGAAVATGVKTANPDLSVWQITGDGDCLAIGGNHFIHSVRRNVDLNVLLFNNQIYGLTKGQYSPTTVKGFVTNSSPFGTVERPYRPGELTIGARGTFFARCLDVDVKTSVEVMTEAAKHKGTSVVEVLVNCIIYNDGAHAWVANKETREERIIVLKHGEKMIFGKNRDKGLILDGFDLKTVTIGENGITENDILTHNAHTQNPALHLLLANMSGPDMPIAMGVIRSVEEETYEAAVHNQIAEVQAKTDVRTFDELVGSYESWDM